MTLSAKQLAFFHKIWEPCCVVVNEQHIPFMDPCIIAAQAILETGWGVHAPGNNYFGIKKWKSSSTSVVRRTMEYVAGKLVSEASQFNAYQDFEDSLRGYVAFIVSNHRYADVRWARGISAQLRALQKSGYSTNPNYSKLLAGIIATLPIPEYNNYAIPIPPVLAVQPAQTVASQPETAPMSTNVLTVVGTDLADFFTKHAQVLTVAGNILKGVVDLAPIPPAASQAIVSVGDQLVSLAEGVSHLATSTAAAAASPTTNTVDVSQTAASGATVAAVPSTAETPAGQLSLQQWEQTMLADMVSKATALLPVVINDLATKPPVGQTIVQEIEQQAEIAGLSVAQDAITGLGTVISKPPTAN